MESKCNFDTVLRPDTGSTSNSTLRMIYNVDLERMTAKDTGSSSEHFKLTEEIAKLDQQYKELNDKLQANVDARIIKITKSISNLVSNLTDQELIFRITYNDTDQMKFKTIFVPVVDFDKTLLHVTKQFPISKIDVFGKILDAKPWVTQLTDLLNN